MFSFANDCRFVGRTLRARPFFTAVAVTSLALGIGANTAIFSLVEATLLRPLPYRSADRLTVLSDTQPCCAFASLSPGEFLETQKRSHAFASMAAMAWQDVALTGVAEPQTLRGRNVTPNFFDVLGAQAEIGRLLSGVIDKPDAESRTAVISDSLWRSTFGADPTIVGRHIVLNSRPFTVVGVLKAQQEYPAKVQVWMTPRSIVPEFEETSNAPADLTKVYGNHWLLGLGRLRPGVTMQAGQAELRTIGERISREQSRSEVHYPKVVPLQGFLVEAVRPALNILAVAVLALLLIGCANLAGLSLARASGRQRELAIRIAMGATRRRILQVLLLESGILAAAGGVLGLGLAHAATLLLQRFSPYQLPPALAPGLNWAVLLFCLAVSAVAALLTGLGPAWQASRVDAQRGLREGSKSTASGQTLLLRRALVAAEIALSAILLVGALLLLRSFERVLATDPGFATSYVTSAMVSLSAKRYPNDAAIVQFWDEALRRVRAIPGVASAGLSSSVPAEGVGRGGDFVVEGHPSQKGANAPYADQVFIGPELLKTLRVPLLAGRAFSDRDTKGSAPVVMINHTAASKLFGRENAVGKHIREDDHSPWITIIGVAGDVKWNGLDNTPNMVLLAPYSQVPDLLQAYLFVRSQPGAPITLGEIGHAIHGLDADVPISEFRGLPEVVDETLGQRRFLLSLLSAFSVLAVFLAALGLYAVLAYQVQQRRSEIGIRVAIGASRQDVLWLVLRDSLTMAAVGLACGLVGAFWASHLLQSLLVGVTQTDAVTYGGAALLISAIALAASTVPALRAMRTDPAIALRYE